MKYSKKSKITIEPVDKHLKQLLKKPGFKKTYMQEKKYLEINLLVERHQINDTEATALLIKQFNKLIVNVANKYSKKEPIAFKDLYQHGVMIFLELCNKYDTNSNVNFVGYIKKYFEGSFTDRMCEI